MIETINTVEDLLRFHEECSARGRELMNKKNHDYSGVVDVFRNFRMFEEVGIVVRMGDKLSRLKSFEEKGNLRVADESIDDTAIDLMNYAILYLAYKRCTTTLKVRRKASDVLNDSTAITYLRARHPFTCQIWSSGKATDCNCSTAVEYKP